MHLEKERERKERKEKKRKEKERKEKKKRASWTLHKGGVQCTVVNTYCIFKNQTQISLIVLAINNSVTLSYKLRTYLA